MKKNNTINLSDVVFASKEILLTSVKWNNEKIKRIVEDMHKKLFCSTGNNKKQNKNKCRWQRYINVFIIICNIGNYSTTAEAECHLPNNGIWKVPPRHKFCTEAGYFESNQNILLVLVLKQCLRKNEQSCDVWCARKLHVYCVCRRQKKIISTRKIFLLFLKFNTRIWRCRACPRCEVSVSARR